MSATPAFTGPQFYDECLGPLTFGPFAALLAQRLPTVTQGQVLELACGTGALTAPLRRQLPASVELVATDLSPAMLDYARTRLAALEGVDWRIADMLALPFADASFAAAACAFGMMFPPDRQAALAEARRVLAAGAPFVFSVWDGIANNPHCLAVSSAMENRFPGDPEMHFHVPYDMNDVERLRQMLAAARFVDVRIECVRLPLAVADPGRIATGLVLGTPRSGLITQRGVALQEVVDLATAELVRTGGRPYQGQAQALLVSARAA